MNERKVDTGYEYKQITTDRAMESLWKDSMANFGWTAEKSEARIVKRMPFWHCGLWLLRFLSFPGNRFRSSSATMSRSGMWK